MATLLSIGFPRPALAAFSLCLAVTASATAAPVEAVRSLAAKEKAPLIETLKGLVAIESGSGDREGLDKIADVIAERLNSTSLSFVEMHLRSWRVRPCGETPHPASGEREQFGLRPSGQILAADR
jgi:hypothetical protein